MRILPILFNTEMVQAILDGRKTVTRRCLKHPFTVHPNGYITKPRGNENLCLYEPPCWKDDVLWVRETWSEDVEDGYIYKADYSEAFIQNPTIDVKWKPSIHMPRAAARIWLKVLNVKVERLQDITENEARAEGAKRCIECIDPLKDRPVIYENCNGYYIIGLKAIWNPTISKKDIDIYGWDANPYVWVISFERTEAPN